MIVAGFGYRDSASVDSLMDAYSQAATEYKASALATLADKADTPAFTELARRLSLPVRHIDPQVAATIKTASDSAYSRAARGTGSVAEASALAALGTHATLIQTRVVSQDKRATCALAHSDAEGETT